MSNVDQAELDRLNLIAARRRITDLEQEIENLNEQNGRLLHRNEILIAQRDELRRIFEPASPLACINPSDISAPLRGGMVRLREGSNAIDDGPDF